jgi:protein TonB
MELRRYQWVLALLFALAVHLALAKLLEPSAPIAANDPGIRIALGGARAADGEGAAEGIESIEANILPAATLEATAIQAIGASALVTATETIRAAEPQPPPPITAVEPASPKPKAERVRTPKTPPARTARAAPDPKPEKRAQTTKPRTSGAKTASVDAKAAGKASAKPGSGGGDAASAAGKAEGGQSKDRYYAQLAAWLERHKRYPSQARKLRQEGIVRVRFVIDRNGKVISHRIEASSGHTALDRAASELLRRASPMPAIPASMGRSRLEIVVPIAYRLR